MPVSLDPASLLPEDLNHRIMYADNWGDALTLLPELTSVTNGYHLESMTWDALPAHGTMVFSLELGTTSPVTPLDLVGKQVIVQVFDTTWKTVWAGEVITQPQQTIPGADTLIGRREYHCRDVLYRLRKWRVDTFTQYTNGNAYKGFGNPGYNTAGDIGLVMGNKGVSGSGELFLGIRTHSWSVTGQAETWTDAEACDHLLISTKPVATEPTITINDPAGMLVRERVSTVTQGEATIGVLDRILSRDGGCVAYQTWAYVDDFPTVQIEVYPIFKDQLTITDPSGGANIIIKGQATAGVANAITVDVEGDQRLGDDAALRFQISKEHSTQYDFVEVYGEPITVLATIGLPDDTIEERWTTTEAAEVDALQVQQKSAAGPKYENVYRVVGLPAGWDGKVGGGAAILDKSLCVYQCNEDGKVASVSTPAGASGPVPPMAITVGDNLPIIAGYNYASDPVLFDSSHDASTFAPMPIQVYRRTSLASTPDAFWNLGDDEGCDVARWGNNGSDLRFTRPGELDVGGNRFWDWHQNVNGSPTPASITVGLVLPFRVGYTAPATARTIKRIYVPGASLHLSHEHAIWALDEADMPAGTDTSEGMVAKRGGGGVLAGTFANSQDITAVSQIDDTFTVAGDQTDEYDVDDEFIVGGSTGNDGTYTVTAIVFAAGFTTISVAEVIPSPTADGQTSSNRLLGNPTKLRDDRRQLAVVKALADQWYTVARQTATWSLKAQGFFGSWTDTVAGSVAYPKLGQLVDSFVHSGQTDTLKTPITSISYDHREGRTTWTTSWGQGDFRAR